MKVIDTKLSEVKIIEYELKETNRGYSYPLYDKFALKRAGIEFENNFENVYDSLKAGTLYGIHFQNQPMGQAKLLYCIEGEGIDYAIDLRKNSPTYLQWISVEMSAKNRRQIFIPSGFGHAFISLVDHTRNVMHFDIAFDSRYSRQLHYDEPGIGITYPFEHPILAPHDVNAPYLDECDINL